MSECEIESTSEDLFWAQMVSPPCSPGSLPKQGLSYPWRLRLLIVCAHTSEHRTLNQTSLKPIPCLSVYQLSDLGKWLHLSGRLLAD